MPRLDMTMHAVRGYSRRGNFGGSVFRCVLIVLWTNDTSYGISVCEKSAVLGIRRYNFHTDPERHKFHNAQRHRQTDRRLYDANSRPYCVTVQSAN